MNISPEQLQQLRDQLSEIKSNQDFFGEVKTAYQAIPTDTKKAIAQKYVSKVKEFSKGKLTAYEAENQEIDHRRLIPLPAALAALQQLEEELIRTQVLDLADLMWKRFKTLRRIYEALHVNWTGVWKILVELWQYIRPPTEAELLDGYTQLIGGVATVSVVAIEAVSAKAFIAVALSVAKERDKCIATMRKKALPQPPAKRYRRRKRAR